MAGYPIKEEELKTFRQVGSRLTGHPERNLEIGVELTTGPLGEGLATAVGLAIGEEYLSNTFLPLIISVLIHTCGVSPLF